MRKSLRDPNPLLPLTPAGFHILLALADGEKHGYAVMQEVAKRSQGKVRLGPGTLYGSIKRMLSEGLIVESDERPDPKLDDERRRYYRLTEFGQRVAQAEAERLEGLVDAARAKMLLRHPKPA
ncbi:MAG: PadR family transcriptional regulator [Acidobacteriota bacterium]